MLPELLFTAVDSMHENASDDFDLLNGVNSISAKGMCLAVHRVTPMCASPIAADDQQQIPSAENDSNSYIGNIAPSSLLHGVKIIDANSIDLFPSHPTTWQQHPMNSLEHAHHRLQNHQHRHHDRYKQRLNLIPSKLLLQNSDDPLICRGANSVLATDDDHPLIIGVSQNADNNKMCQLQTIQTKSPANFETLSFAAASKQLPKRVALNGCSSVTKQQLKVKAGLMSAQNRAAMELKKSAQSMPNEVGIPQHNYRPSDSKLSKKKGILKLRFHHQALPPEYLSHYEATQGKLSQRVKYPISKVSEANPKIKVFHPSKLPPPKSTHENVRSWLQKIAAIHRSAQQTESRQRGDIADQVQKKPNHSIVEALNDINNNSQVSRMQVSRPSLADELAKNKETHVSSKPLYDSEKYEPIKSSKDKVAPSSVTLQPNLLTSVLTNTTSTDTASTATSKRVINYADLPYMGEITLDHSKPRRGRKPKKADICHLIYKNYGTIFPGTPKNVIITPHVTTGIDAGPPNPNNVDDSPLNLCVRDQQCDHLSISSEECENVQSLSAGNSTRPTEGEKSLNAELENLFNHNFKVEQNDKTGNSTPTTPLTSNTNSSERNEVNSSGALIHPVNLYYQKLLSGTLVNQHSQPFGLPVETIEKDNQLTLKIHIPNGLLQTPKSEVNSHLSVDSPTIDYPDLMSTPSSIKSEHSNITTATSVSATTSTATTTTPTHKKITPQKRKRSAIFIPPIPAENATNPATEVSICKFKFTGGAKPSLQEKKMLSVDSGGNYRYYSGTGDKSTRGYEFFPRESLQNSAGFLPGVNCAVTFPNAINECSMSDIPPPSAELSNEILQLPEFPSGTLLSGSVTLPVPSSPSRLSKSTTVFSCSPVLPTQQQTHSLQTLLSSNCNYDMAVRNASSTIVIEKEHLSNHVFKPLNSDNSLQRKRKPRRSSQREKLEKTFKEKGFLIQTQQLESAEGATYCKFRQLKKFTRYLFRNWKDYLPEEIHQANRAVDEELTENDVRKAVDTTPNFDQIDQILEQGFLVTSGVSPKNSDQATTTGDMIEKIGPERHSVGETEET